MHKQCANHFHVTRFRSTLNPPSRHSQKPAHLYTDSSLRLARRPRSNGNIPFKSSEHQFIFLPGVSAARCTENNHLPGARNLTCVSADILGPRPQTSPSAPPFFSVLPVSIRHESALSPSCAPDACCCVDLVRSYARFCPLCSVSVRVFVP